MRLLRPPEAALHRPAPSAPTAPAAAVRTLQRAAGNAAVGRMLQRDPAARRLLQRSPRYKADPPWSVKGGTQQPSACVPLSLVEASFLWDFLSKYVPGLSSRSCTCHEVEPVWNAYFSATGTPKFIWKESDTPQSCIIIQLKGDRANRAAEDPIVEAVRTAMPGLVSQLRGQTSVTLTLAQAGVPAALLSPPLRFGNPLTVGGQLFGGISKPDPVTGVRPDDSEYGPDTRRIDGTVRLTRRHPNPLDVDQIEVMARFDLGFHLTDALDFCPGNTNGPPGIREVLIGLSRLEASGMARDIYLEAHYTRTRDAGPWGPFPNPDPKRIPVPGGALFEFGSAELTPQAEIVLLNTLGDRPSRADTSRPVVVRGHTDSIGQPERNRDLSERRARAVKRVLEQRYPNLEGHVEAVGLGDREPVAPNEIDGRDNPDGRALNRRVEIQMTELVTP